MRHPSILVLVALAVMVGTIAVWQPAAAEEFDWYNQSGRIGDWPSEMDGRYPVGLPAGENWRMVSGDGQRWTSDCIGDFRSPDCIVDTIMACEAWSPTEEPTLIDKDGYEYYWHPVCELLRSTPGDPSVGVRNFGTVEKTEYREDWISYYRTASFILSEETKIPYLHRRAYDPPCGKYSRCMGDTVSVLQTVWCTPDPALVGRDRGYFHRADYPDGSPMDYCIELIPGVAVFTRRREDGDGWYLVGTFAAGLEGSAYKGWPYLEAVAQGMR